MKKETQLLLVLIVLLLSIGPLSFFFEKPQEIGVPEKPPEQQPITYKFSGNLSGEIVSLDPYISFVGISSFLNESLVRERIGSAVPGNYSLSISLNPSGPGYRYSIAVPLNGSSTVAGFRLAYRLSDVFDLSRSVPVRQGLVQLFPSFERQSGNATINVTTEGEKVPATFLYSRDTNTTVKVYCKEYVTSRKYNFVAAKDCYDTEPSYYYGLLNEKIAVFPKLIEMDVTLKKVENESRFEGTFPYGRMNRTGLEQMLLNISGVANASVETMGPESRMDISGFFAGGDFDANASRERLLNISGVTEASLSGNETVSGSIFFSGNASVSGIADAAEAALSLSNFTYSLPAGNYWARLEFTNQSASTEAYRLLAGYGLDIAKSYGFGLFDLPENITLEGQVYDLFRFREVRAKTHIETGPGPARVRLEISVMYGEVLDYPPMEAEEI